MCLKMLIDLLIKCITCLLLQAIILSGIYAESDKSESIEGSSLKNHLDSVIGIINEKGLNKIDPQNAATEMFKAYLKSIDPYADYLTKDEYEAFKALEKRDYGDVGLDIKIDSAGHMICAPLLDGPSEQKGVEKGDILVAVNGITVSGKPEYLVNSEIRGEVGKTVTLTIKKVDDINKEIIIKRTPPETYFLKMDSYGEFLFIKMTNFTSKIGKILENKLSDVEGTRPIVIDLRGNMGGDLHAAIDCAMLFLKKEQKIVDLKNDKGAKSFKATIEPVNTKSPIYFWQDKRMVGAAEVFVAALTQNKRAVSIGIQSGGKGTYQEITELSDGAALKLTTSVLQLPDGTSFDKQGIGPVYPLDKLVPDENDYWVKTQELHRGSDDTVLSPQEGFFICFEKEFDSEEEAEFWALEVRNSLDNPPDQFLLETAPKDNGKTKFNVCLGPFENEEMGTEKLSHVSEEMNTPMFVEMMTIDE